MVLDECPKLTRDKKILSKSIGAQQNGQRGKTEFGNVKADFIKI